MTIRARSALAALVATGALALVLLSATAAAPPDARAASCQVLQTTLAGGTLTVEGGNCQTYSEEIVVDCLAGSVWTVYWMIDLPPPGELPAVSNSGIPCASVNRLAVNGHEGFDTLDLRTVTPATGFTAIGSNQNQVSGGDGPDTMIGSMFADAFSGGNDDDRIFARDGGADSIDCGAGTDLAETDQASLDTVTGCENVFALPAAASQKKICKKHRGKRARAAKKCRKKKR